MTTHITVTIQPGRHPTKYDARITFPLKEELVYGALERLDMPDVNAPAYAQMICTSELKIRLVMAERERVANVIADEIIPALIEAMGANDTKMGYQNGAKP